MTELTLDCHYSYNDVRAHFAPTEESREKMRRFGLYMRDVTLQIPKYYHAYVGRDVKLRIRIQRYNYIVGGAQKEGLRLNFIEIKLNE